MPTSRTRAEVWLRSWTGVFLACVSEDDTYVLNIAEVQNWMAGHIMAARPLVSAASVWEQRWDFVSLSVAPDL